MSKKVDKYTLCSKIGNGSYGVVYKGIHESKAQQFAVKVVPNQIVASNQKLEDCLINEVQTLSKIDKCQFIIKYIEMIRTKNNYYFVYQFCNGGNLHEKIQNDGPLGQKEALKIFYQLLEAFKVLNRLNVMHRDLKPDNIFLHNGKAKLGDFGFCKTLKAEENMTKTMLGSPIYMAPEILKGQAYTTKADIWSLGVILYEMVFGFCPFQSGSIAMLISKINQTDIHFPDKKCKLSSNTKALIKKMLNKDYIRRAGWVELFNEGINADGQWVADKGPLRQFTQKEITEASKPASTTRRNIMLQDMSIDKKRDQSKQNIKVKGFYSQKYMDLLSMSHKNLDFNTSRIRPQQSKRTSLAKNQQAQKHFNTQNSEIRKKQFPVLQIFKKYQQCSQMIQTMYQYIKKNDYNCMGYSCLVLERAHQIISSICSQLQGQEQYEQFTKILNFELSQLSKQSLQVRKNLKNMHIRIPAQRERNPLAPKQIVQFLNERQQ